VANICFERAISDIFIQLFNNLESTYLTELVQYISKEMETAKLIAPHMSPLVDRRTWIYPVINIEHFDFVIHETCANTHILCC